MDFALLTVKQEPVEEKDRMRIAARNPKLSEKSPSGNSVSVEHILRCGRCDGIKPEVDMEVYGSRFLDKHTEQEVQYETPSFLA